MKAYLVVGAGRTLIDQQDSVLKFIDKVKPITVGINNITSFCVPDYHLWTNTKRFVQFHSCIRSESNLLFSKKMSKKLIKKHYKGKYKLVNYGDNAKLPLSITPGRITGSFRTAGVLAIALIYSWNNDAQIFIVGMDGYTLHPHKNLKDRSESQHCYGEGFSDDSTWKECVKKDERVHMALSALRDYGVSFRIITDTKFVDFYDASVLGNLE